MEVLECDNAHTAAVPSKILENRLRYTRSEEDLTVYRQTAGSSGSSGSPRPEFTVYGPHPDFDDVDCWSLEDDEIIQVRIITTYRY